MKHKQCLGFRAAAVAAGIKKLPALDLGLLVSDAPATAAGVFTRNRVVAAPVFVSREHLQKGQCRAIVANAGNANCYTGPQGLADARRMAAAAGQALGLRAEQVLVASTGVIGQPLPVEKITAALPDAARQLSADGLPSFARAIMTTDTVPKTVFAQAAVGGQSFSIAGCAKGAGMIRPDMATMLAFICTDAALDADVLQEALAATTERTFNRITVDGDTSTNDMVLVLANGQSKVAIDSESKRSLFCRQLETVMGQLARMIVKDGEGATKLVEIEVRGAVDDRQARRVADTIAHSPLVKTAFFGQDANWGRILAAAGRAGVALEPDRMDLYFDDAQMVKAGMCCGPQAEQEATAVLKKPEFRVALDLHQGSGKALVLTCDLSVEYVRINADYRS